MPVERSLTVLILKLDNCLKVPRSSFQREGLSLPVVDVVTHSQFVVIQDSYSRALKPVRLSEGTVSVLGPSFHAFCFELNLTRC